MNIIQDLADYLEQIAPLDLQESYDNSGLIIGNTNWIIKNVLVALDVTEAVIDEKNQREKLCGKGHHQSH